MSNGQEDVSSQPLVIVRRRRSTDEEHHGGVWKIAYADFMTAMMAFFLVMWLINAADKKTIVQVAAYFNPMRLTDRVAVPKGLEDLNEIDTKQSEEKSKKGLNKQLDQKQKLDAPKASKDNIGEAMDEEAQKTSAAAGGKSAEAQKEEALFRRREVQRREPVDGFKRRIGAATKQQRDDFAFSGGGRVDQSGRSVGVAMIHVNARSDQHFDGVEALRCAGEPDRIVAVAVRRIHFSAVGDQFAHDGDIALGGRFQERRHAFSVRAIEAFER